MLPQGHKIGWKSGPKVLSATLFMVLLGCGSQPGSAIQGMIGTEVVVSAEPTVILRGSSSEVRENRWQGVLVSADREWVVLRIGAKLQAVDRGRIDTLISAAE